MAEARELVAQFIRRDLNQLPEGTEIPTDEDLFEGGWLDSHGVLLVVNFIEDRFRLRVPEKDVVANFRTLRSIAAYVDLKQAGRPA